MIDVRNTVFPTAIPGSANDAATDASQPTTTNALKRNAPQYSSSDLP